MMTRRNLAGVLGLALPGWPVQALSQASNPILERADAVMGRLKARIGVAVFDHETGRTIERNADQAFPITSTFKAFAAAALLANVDAGKDQLSRRVHFSRETLVTYSPITEARAGEAGMTLEEICESACTMSDNTAGNLLLQAIGGPSGFTSFMRGIGDNVTRLDRIETALNEGTPGDARDTTSPRAAASSLDKILLGHALSDASRDKLQEWMIGNKVAGPLLRSRIPADWKIADRSGAGGNGSRSIIALMWAPHRKPVTAAIYITETSASMEDRNAAVAELGSVIATTLTM
jgi:beta-lactamase class A